MTSTQNAITEEQVLLKKLVKQLKILNFWVAFFGFLFIISMVVTGFMLYKVLTFAHNTEQKVTNIQTKASQTLDVKNQVCSDDTISSLLGKTSDYCK